MSITKLMTAFLVLFSLILSQPLRAADDATTTGGHYPILQGNTDETTTHFNMLGFRLKTYAFRALPKNGVPIVGEMIGEPYQDEQKKLHRKAVKVKFTGLSPETD